MCPTMPKRSSPRSEIHNVLGQRHAMAGPGNVGRPESRRPESAKIRPDGAPPGRLQLAGYRIPAAWGVRPAVDQEHWPPVRRAAGLVADSSSTSVRAFSMPPPASFQPGVIIAARPSRSSAPAGHVIPGTHGETSLRGAPIGQAGGHELADHRIELARQLYERSVFGGDASALAAADRQLDAVEADLALARGRVIHARFLAQRGQDPRPPSEDPRELALFERAVYLYQALGDVRGAAESQVPARTRLVRHRTVRHRTVRRLRLCGAKPFLTAGGLAGYPRCSRRRITVPAR